MPNWYHQTHQLFENNRLSMIAYSVQLWLSFYSKIWETAGQQAKSFTGRFQGVTLIRNICKKETIEMVKLAICSVTNLLVAKRYKSTVELIENVRNLYHININSGNFWPCSLISRQSLFCINWKPVSSMLFACYAKNAPSLNFLALKEAKWKIDSE